MTIPTNPSLDEQWTNDATGVTYKWDGERWFIVDNTEDIDLSGYVTDAEFEADQQRQDDVVTEALSTQEDIQDEQEVQNNQINALETQLQLLAQTQAVGKWTYQRNVSGGSIRPPSTSTFYATHTDGASTVLLNWSDARLFMVSKTDVDGKEFVFTEFEEGDKMEILATDGSSACFGTVTNNPTQDTYGNMILAVERSSGGPSEGKDYLISVYRPGSNGGEVDLDILDGRYLVKTGDTMTGNLTLNGAGLYTDSIVKSTRNSGYAFQVKPDDVDATAFIHTNGNAEFAKVTVEAEPANDTDLANKSYVDTKVGDYLPLTGGEMTGGIDIDRESGAGLQLFKDGTSNLIAWVDGGITTTKTTFNDDQLVTKSYVDTEIDNVDLSGYLQKSGGTMTGELNINIGNASNAIRLQQDGTDKVKLWNTNSEARLQVYNGQVFKVIGYVDDRVTQLFGVSDTGRVTLANLRDPSGNRDAATKAYVDSALAGPARLSWKWDSTSSGDSAPATGAFKLTTNGGDNYYRLSFESYNGINLGSSIINEFNRTIDNGPVGTIWYKEANGWKFKQQFRINTFRWNYNNHFEFRVTSRNGSTSFTAGTPYHITIGGFF